ncbi:MULTISPECIES: dephospho-CoA kinase [Fusobacterium]|uniref:dephospho-CoA kinase n=1 Tax=Fusobacterium TaxID=848 RepID=UPI001F4F6932|nr:MULTISPECIES: dephospho-CoA kinase [Fusobacterium]MCI5724640.1 dephospho-CoA kinase [Fusobacterium sp.]MDD7410050.1 dephospho-CoA kinase [Fusobacteriaceae bacterium]MDY5305598.1 dephospho-CoA kinase [Fusobacterium gastrosuis]MDY5712410.1 dephospho-CoA kinase [Fusobacterium gastrosuis]
MIVGLTGGIASGKSTVSNYLKNKNYKIFDADLIAKEISQKKEVEEEIVSNFGVSILDESTNKIDRKKLKKAVFEDEKKLNILNSIIHPKVYSFFENIKIRSKKEEVIIFDVPLLFESGMDKLCDKIVLVSSDDKIKIARMIKRDMIDEKLAEKIISVQMSDVEKIKKADIVIENNGSLEELFSKIERFCENL